MCEATLPHELILYFMLDLVPTKSQLQVYATSRRPATDSTHSRCENNPAESVYQ